MTQADDDRRVKLRPKPLVEVHTRCLVAELPDMTAFCITHGIELYHRSQLTINYIDE